MLKLNPDNPLATKVQTRDGREAEIYAIKEGQRYPVFGAMKDCEGVWEQAAWFADGTFSVLNRESPCDLVNAPEPPVKVERYALINRGSGRDYVQLYQNKDVAVVNMDSSTIAGSKVEITYTPGVFEE